jgi:ABC-type bacteriocin/lantibiotic exporter with double-glycine peptidase domain
MNLSVKNYIFSILIAIFLGSIAYFFISYNNTKIQNEKLNNQITQIQTIGEIQTEQEKKIEKKIQKQYKKQVEKLKKETEKIEKMTEMEEVINEINFQFKFIQNL